MSAWTRLRDWLNEPVDFFGNRAPVAEDVPTNDELVTALEWVTIGGQFPLSFYTVPEAIEEALSYGRTDIADTLRKLVAA